MAPNALRSRLAGQYDSAFEPSERDADLNEAMKGTWGPIPGSPVQRVPKLIDRGKLANVVPDIKHLGVVVQSISLILARILAWQIRERPRATTYETCSNDFVAVGRNPASHQHRSSLIRPHLRQPLSTHDAGQ